MNIALNSNLLYKNLKEFERVSVIIIDISILSW